jgi:hypothetical protein
VGLAGCCRRVLILATLASHASFSLDRQTTTTSTLVVVVSVSAASSGMLRCTGNDDDHQQRIIRLIFFNERYPSPLPFSILNGRLRNATQHRIRLSENDAAVRCRKISYFLPPPMECVFLVPDSVALALCSISSCVVVCMYLARH